MIIFLSQQSATSSSWVTIITAMPFLFKSLKSFITSFEVLESNAPVGSSAKITDGLLTIALAIATLCR